MSTHLWACGDNEQSQLGLRRATVSACSNRLVAIVNLGRVRELRRHGDGRWILTLADGTQLPVSRRRREQLMRRLG